MRVELKSIPLKVLIENDKLSTRVHMTEYPQYIYARGTKHIYMQARTQTHTLTIRTIDSQT